MCVVTCPAQILTLHLYLLSYTILSYTLQMVPSWNLWICNMHALGSPPPTFPCLYCPQYVCSKSGCTRHIQALHNAEPASHEPNPSLSLLPSPFPYSSPHSSSPISYNDGLVPLNYTPSTPSNYSPPPADHAPSPFLTTWHYLCMEGSTLPQIWMLRMIWVAHHLVVVQVTLMFQMLHPLHRPIAPSWMFCFLLLCISTKMRCRADLWWRWPWPTAQHTATSLWLR